MIGQKIQGALNAHVTAELYSANLYLAMSAYCESRCFKGFARWLRVQHSEEMEHSHKMLDHLVTRGGVAAIGAIPAPPREFGTILQVFEKVLEHERQVTQGIDDLYRAAVSEQDSAAQVFLQWFIGEQVEEEAAAQEIVDKLKMVGDRSSAALYLDKEYGKRKTASPAGTA
jgi:ferritin